MSEWKSPVYSVIPVPLEKVVANDYNPNKQDKEAFRLLYISIKDDGYTQPVVCYHDKEKDIYIIVDGFHRYSVMKEYKDIYEREHGLLPVVVIDKPKEERICSTIRHNRARGTHDVDLMSDIVTGLVESGMSDSWIMEKLGMSKDELLRLKQVSGLTALFADKDFSKSWLPQ